jgi:hypothetical protein
MIGAGEWGDKGCTLTPCGDISTRKDITRAKRVNGVTRYCIRYPFSVTDPPPPSRSFVGVQTAFLISALSRLSRTNPHVSARDCERGRRGYSPIILEHVKSVGTNSVPSKPRELRWNTANHRREERMLGQLRFGVEDVWFEMTISKRAVECSRCCDQ